MSVSRRAFLVAAAAGAVAGCSGSGHGRVLATTTTSTTLPVGAAQPSGDLAFAARAAAVENTLAGAYGSLVALDRLGAVPVGLKGLWETFESHHRDHATAWNAVLTAAGDNVVPTTDDALSGAVVTPGIAAVKDIDGAIAFAAGLERAAAATYLLVIEGVLTTPGALQTAAAIQPMELQHVAILAMLSGSDPVPGSFATTAGALSLT